MMNRTTLQVFVTYLIGAPYVHPLWFYKHQHDNIKCIVYDNLLKPWQSFRITLYFMQQINWNVIVSVTVASNCERTWDRCERVSYDGGSGWFSNKGAILRHHHYRPSLHSLCGPLFTEPADGPRWRPGRRPRYLHRYVGSSDLHSH